MTSRTHLRVVALALVASSIGLLSACGSGGDSSGTATTGVQTINGHIAVPENPERVVVLDSQSVDVVFELGITPVAWDNGSFSSTIEETPWLAGIAGNSFQKDLVGSDNSVDFEAVLAADPDLIIADPLIATKGEVFDRLNGIAPTITSDVDRAQSWQERTTFLANALRMPDKGEEAIASTNTAIADQAKGLESLAGMTYYYVAYSIDEGGLRYGNGTWFEGYGFKPAPNQDNTYSNSHVVSLERVTEFNADILGIWAITEADKADLQANAQFNELPAVKAGRVVWLDVPMALATNNSGPRSVVWALKQATPQLAKTVG
jgi:iron complex transport system substrate-binding protein